MDSPIRVMLADQSSEQTELLRAALEDAGFAVVAAVGTGDEALEQLRAAAPDVLVTDLLLPGLDGLSLLHRAKEAGFLPHTIILSAFWNDRLARAAMRLGVDDCLQKPCRADALFDRIRSLATGEAERRCLPDSEIRRAMRDFLIPSHLDGYRYLCEGISRVREDRGCLQGVTKVLYREIAKTFHTTPECVERSMRTAVLTGWRAGTAADRRRTFGPAFDGCRKAPSNTFFLAAMADYLDLSESVGEMYR